jgi:DNA-directed RNA polymerase alpha subunit
MSIIPLHLQRRFEERWAARFGSLVIAPTKQRRIERFAAQHRPRGAKAKENTILVEAEDEGKMIDDKKSTDPGLSAAERKALRGHEAQEAIADHQSAQKAFHENRERLREERMVREAAEGPMVAPTPELPDDTPIERVLFSTRIQNALRAADLKTVGEVREMSDETLISLPDLGKASLAALREELGLPSTDGVRSVSKKPV